MEKETTLYSEAWTNVRFCEVDSLRIVWHGHYIRYFEDAREAFGQKYNISYMEVYDKGYSIPLVNISCDYKRPLKYGDKVRIECRYINSPAAKLIFSYRAFLNDTEVVVAEGRSVQIFLDMDNKLQLYAPQFYLDWKKNHRIEL
jgi:acyl-CoA thioester hydrolase